jgi:hypothetical protein
MDEQENRSAVFNFGKAAVKIRNELFDRDSLSTVNNLDDNCRGFDQAS